MQSSVREGAAPLGPRGNAILGSIGAIYRDPLGFTAGLARYGRVASYRVAHMRIYQVNDPAGVERILHDNHRNYSKDVATFKPLRMVVGNGLFTSDGGFWLRQRRLMQPAFHRRRVAVFGELMTDATVTMLERWVPRARAGEPIDVAAEFSRLTLEVVTTALFGSSVRNAEDIGRAVSTLLDDVTFRFSFPFYPPPSFPTPRNRRFVAARSLLDRTIYGMVSARRGSGENGGHDDLLTMLMRARDEETGEGMSDRQLRDEVLTMFIAGHETTATALAWAAYLLATNAEPARRLREEVDRVLGGRVPATEDAPFLPYSRMVIDETLRLYPPVWITDRRAVEADTVCGYGIPKDATVSVSPYVAHHDPAVWENPKDFDPERFAPERRKDRPDYSYFPFGGGPRLCIGRGFALLEATLVLALVCGRYELCPIPGRRVEVAASATLRPRGGLLMTARPRTGVDA